MTVHTIDNLEWLTISQAAMKLNCSESKIRTAIKEKKLNYFRDGKLIRIQHKDLQQYINERMKVWNSDH